MRGDEAVISAIGDGADNDSDADIGQQALAFGIAGGIGRDGFGGGFRRTVGFGGFFDFFEVMCIIGHDEISDF